MIRIPNYEHSIAAHCESGTVRNLMAHHGLKLSEPMVFALGSGPGFFYLFFSQGPSGFPLIGLRTPPGTIFKNIQKLGGASFISKQYRNTAEALKKIDDCLTKGIPIGACVDMFYMTYLPSFLQVHAPFHFIVIFGREGDTYYVSDPYFQNIGQLPAENLRAALETHAPMAKNNFLFHIETVSPAISWKEVIPAAISRTCKDMIVAPVINKLFFFVGVEGMRTYAKKMRLWPGKYQGVRLREGILFQAVGFEDQGTGGGAFRLIYGAFLQEAGSILSSDELSDLADRIIQHGYDWKNTSRQIIQLGKTIPMTDEEYEDWYSSNGRVFEEGLGQISEWFVKAAEFEKVFFQDLRAAASRIRRST